LNLRELERDRLRPITSHRRIEKKREQP